MDTRDQLHNSKRAATRADVVIRFLIWLCTGLIVATLAALLFQPHYLELCNAGRVENIGCSPVSQRSMVGIFIVGLGLISMILIPIFTSLRQVMKYGYDVETSRTETLTSNLPILAGLIYVAIGAAFNITAS